jgi:peptidyl-prolyl isomerase D
VRETTSPPLPQRIYHFFFLRKKGLSDAHTSFCSVRVIENYPTASDVPKSPIIIAACGELSPNDPSLEFQVDIHGDRYEDYPEDQEGVVGSADLALNAAKEIREIANRLFKEGNIQAALEKYQSTTSSPTLSTSLSNHFVECIRYLDIHTLTEDTSEQKTAINALLAPLLLNSALAALRLQPPSSENAETAVKYTSRALDKLELSNADKGEVLFSDTSCKTARAQNKNLPAKAFYRRGIALSMLKDDEGAEENLLSASRIVPEDQQITSELTKVQQRIKERREKEKRGYKKMFA